MQVRFYSLPYPPLFPRRSPHVPRTHLPALRERLSSPHHKFYEVEVELSLFYPKRLVRRWGRIGSRRPRSIRMVMAGPDELACQVEVIAGSDSDTDTRPWLKSTPHP